MIVVQKIVILVSEQISFIVDEWAENSERSVRLIKQSQV